MFIALDIASDKANFCLLDQAGDLHHQGEITLKELHRSLTGGPLAKNPPIAAAMEYTGRLAKPWAELLLASEVPAYYVHSTDRKAHSRIAGESQKTDPADARMLAHLLWVWIDPDRRRTARYRNHLLISAEKVRVAWELRTLVAAANKAVAVRVAAEQRSLAAARARAQELAQAWKLASKSSIPELSLELALELAQQEFPQELQQLQTIPGVGPHTALTLIAYLSPAERFIEREAGRDHTRANLKRYAGMHPRVSQSGASADRHRMSKAGQPPLRSAVWRAALVNAGLEGQLGQMHARYVAAGARPGLSLQRVAAHILVIAHKIMVTGKEYEDPGMPKVVKEPQPPGTLTQTQAASQLGISRQAINEAIHKGRLASVKWGSKQLVKQIDIARMRGEPEKAAIHEEEELTVTLRYAEPGEIAALEREKAVVMRDPDSGEKTTYKRVTIIDQRDPVEQRIILPHELETSEERYPDGN